MFARADAPNWVKWKFYPGAMTIMIPRIVIGFSFFVILLIVVSILLIGHRSSEPLKPGCRKYLLRLSYTIFSYSLSFVTFWTVMSYDYVESSYEYYLGK
jgi:hypothetical protein